MTKNKMNPKIDEFLNKTTKWQEEMTQLREIILECGLTEELKWNKPCYTFQNNNIAIMQPFKEYFALMFFKGILITDVNNILVKPGENSQTQRQIRFTNTEEVVQLESIIKDYINEAVEKANVEVNVDKKEELEIPVELLQKFDEYPDLKTAFEALTLGRQRAYVIYFSKAKQSKTRESRIEKYMEQILAGKGLHD
ncbi:YdeI/OmpD-associated family protein [Lederbergia graminis]|uniref:YdeI family protein n=1 Tax=Lederbergia graminis TaxID=735518 RepID=A0ABW0LFR7_9BACI